MNSETYLDLAGAKVLIIAGSTLLLSALGSCAHRDAGAYLRISVDLRGDCFASAFKVVDSKTDRTILIGEPTGREFSTMYMWRDSEGDPEFQLRLMNGVETLGSENLPTFGRSQQKRFEFFSIDGQCSIRELN